MKQFMKLGSLLTMVMLLAMGTMVTSCGDDDDEGGGSQTINKVVLNGKELAISKVEYNPEDLENGNYNLWLYFTDGTGLNFQLSGVYDNQPIDMTKTDPEEWYWIFNYLNNYNIPILYSDGDATTPHPCDAGSTMKVRCLNKTTGEFEGTFKVIKNDITMNGYYKGTFTPYVPK